MLKMHNSSNKLSKIASAEGSLPPAPLNLRYWWLKGAWLAKLCFSNWLWRSRT